MKRIFSLLLLAVLLVFTLASCGSKKITAKDLDSHAQTGMSDFKYTSDGEDGICITKYTGTDEIVVVPETIDGKPVTTIGRAAFDMNTVAKAVSLPDSVVTMEASAFFNNAALEIVTTGKGLRYIGGYAFQSCVNLHTVVLHEGLEMIDQAAFNGCESLKEVTIPESVTEMNWPFFGAEHVKILCKPGSFAESFAKENNLTYAASK